MRHDIELFQRYSEHSVSCLFLLLKGNRKVESIVTKDHPLWTSISLLIAAVIAVLAFVRGNWMLLLLFVVFAVWGLWAFVTLGLPVLR